MSNTTHKRDWTGGYHSLFVANGDSNHTDAERQKEDYYATSPIATEWLCKLEEFGSNILEPSCGQGHISEVLKAHGYNVESRDIVNRGYGDVADFLAIDNVEWQGDIVTNPPYKYAKEFVEKALNIIPDGRKVAMFLKLTFLEGKGRRELFKSAPPPSGLGVIIKAYMRTEWRIRQGARLCGCIRMVCVGERIQRRYDNKMVQLSNVETI